MVEPAGVQAAAVLTKELGAAIAAIIVALATLIPTLWDARKIRLKAKVLDKTDERGADRSAVLEFLEERISSLRKQIEDVEVKLQECQADCEQHRHEAEEKERKLDQLEKTVDALHKILERMPTTARINNN